MEDIDYDSIARDDLYKALPILLFLTMKRDNVTLKGRACADGRRQRLWMQKENAASPTVTVEALFFVFLAAARE